jgi:hypothetical protein
MRSRRQGFGSSQRKESKIRLDAIGDPRHIAPEIGGLDRVFRSGTIRNAPSQMSDGIQVVRPIAMF